MTPQERQMVDDLFDRLSKMESAQRDPDATAAITQGLRSAPNAIYPLVQTVLVQDEALRHADDRIQQLEEQLRSAPPQGQSGGFLDSMRGAVFGQVLADHDFDFLPAEEFGCADPLVAGQNRSIREDLDRAVI